MPHLNKDFKKLKVLSIRTSFFLCFFISVPYLAFSQCVSGVIINEFHYDNISTDIDEFVEIAVPANIVFNPADYVVTLYNGNGGVAYDNESMSNFTVGMTDLNYTYYIWKPNNIENGPDGIALSMNTGGMFTTCEFLSYEGAFTATNGPAMNMTSTDIGVSEPTTTPIGSSLQRINGQWVGPTPATPGQTNAVIAAPDVILISEISLCNQLIELQNVGTANVDISTWRLCNAPDYDPLSATTLVSGSLQLSPGDFVTVRWVDMDPAMGEIGLYLPTGGFTSAASIVDYVQYNSINNTRAPVAVLAGVWDDAGIGITADGTPGACMSSIANGAAPSLTSSATWCTSQDNTLVPPVAGTNTGCFVPSCDITALDAANFTCMTSTPGIDMVQVDVSYIGMDPNAMLIVTVNGSAVTNIGDDPTMVMNGTISFMASEGNNYQVTFSDVFCNTLDESGMIPLTLCISCPSIGDLIITEIMYNPTAMEPQGEWVEICNTSGSPIDMIGMEIGDSGATDHTIASSLVVPIGGCVVISHTDLTVCGGASSDYQHGSFGLAQAGDDVEIKCNGLTLDIVTYDGGGTFPSEANGEAISFDSSVPQTVTDNDNGANWCIASTACGADDFGTPGVLNPVCLAMCGITFLGTPVYTCQSSTAGVDPVKVDVNYGGVDPDAILSITVNGNPVINGGSDPQMDVSGTISFAAMEGDPIIVTFTDPLCMNLIIDTTVPANQCPDPALCTNDLYINGVIDGDLPGGLPKAVQFCASADIADLSIFGVESVTNGTGSNGVEYNFPPDPLAAGECIWVSADLQGFASFFGFLPCYVDNVVVVNGDDAIMLYCGSVIIDQLGDPNCDPNSSLPDCGIWEYMDGWVFAIDNVANPVFNPLEWIYSMENALDGETSNATAVRPYPLPGTMCPDLLYPVVNACPDDYANGGLPNSQAPLTGLQDVDADYEADGDIISDQIIGSVNPAITVDYDSGTSITLNKNFEVKLGVLFHAFIDGCGGI